MDLEPDHNDSGHTRDPSRLEGLPFVILAAGASRRMGADKALLWLRDRPLIRWHVESGRAAGGTPVVVTRRGSRAVADAAGCAVVWVDDGDAPMAASVRAALRAVPTPAGCLVTPVDVAPASLGTLEALARPGDRVPVGPDGRRGHPVRLSASTCERVRRELPEGGLRDWLVSAALAPVPDLVADDFDTPSAWATFLATWVPDDEARRRVAPTGSRGDGG